MLQTFNVPVGGRQIDAKASFFRYESSSGGGDEIVRVRVAGNDLGNYLPGDSIELPQADSRWEILPVSPTQTCIVRLGLGRVQTARLVGNVRVIDEITDSALYQTNTLATAVTAFSMQQLVAPAANVRGLILRQFQLTATAGAGGFINNRLVAARTAPTSFSMPAQQWVPAQVSNLTATPINVSSAFTNKLLPAGWGIWHVWSIGTAVAAANYSEMTTELL